MPLDKETRAEILALLQERDEDGSDPALSDSGLTEFLTWQRGKRTDEEDAEDATVLSKKRRKKFWGWFFGVMLPALPASWYGYVQLAPTPEPPEPVVEPVDVKREVETRVGGLEKTINGCESKTGDDGKVVACTTEEEETSVKHTSEQADKKANRLGDLHFEQQRLMVDQYDAIRAAQNATDRRARKVKDPPSMDDARDQLKAYDELKARKKLDAALKKGDPFDGI